jgi:hypothetical protein
MKTLLAIVADFDSTSRSHAATNDAIAYSADALGVAVEQRFQGRTKGVVVVRTAKPAIRPERRIL